jgi:hypothetical protein
MFKKVPYIKGSKAGKGWGSNWATPVSLQKGQGQGQKERINMADLRKQNLHSLNALRILSGEEGVELDDAISIARNRVATQKPATVSP